MPELRSTVRSEVMSGYRLAWKIAMGFFDGRGFFSDERCDWWCQVLDERRKEEETWTKYLFKRLFPDAFPKPLPGFKDKEDVRSKVEAANVLSHYGIPFRQVADALLFRCPWHDDKNASASFSVKKKLYFCHPCSRGGDLFDFVMRMDGICFQDAIGELDFWG